MQHTDLVRRHVMQFAALAAPALAFGARTNSREAGTVWSADGQHRFFNAPDGIHWASADGRQHGLLLPLGLNFALMPGSVAPATGHLAYTALDRRTGSNIWTVAVERRGDQLIAGAPEMFFHGASFDVSPTFSGDGRKISYASRQAGSWTIQVRSFPV